MADGNPFSRLNAEVLNAAAQGHGFMRKGQRNRVRRTADFVQLVNLQHSQWSSEERYLNFAMWPLALGEPPTIAESKFHFRTRGAYMGANDVSSFFATVDELSTLGGLREANTSGRIAGLVTKELRGLLT